MQPLAPSLRKSLASAVDLYHAQVETVMPYLAERGLDARAVAAHRLGFVGEPQVGHEEYTGRLAIPYFTVDGRVCGLRFRAVPEVITDGPKYLGIHGLESRLFNLQCLADPLVTEIVVCEGEIDTITMDLCGYPAVGVSGANGWKHHHPRILEGFDRVWVVADGDNPGRKFASEVARTIPGAGVIHCPPGEDVNSIFVAKGKDGIDELFKESE